MTTQRSSTGTIRHPGVPLNLPMVAAEALAEHLGIYAEAGPDGLVFPTERGGRIRRSNFTRRVWIPATRTAGVEGLRFHDLRHTAATLAIAAGASTRELMARMGTPPRRLPCGTSTSWAAGTPPSRPPWTSWSRRHRRVQKTRFPVAVAHGWHEPGNQARRAGADDRPG